MHSCLRSALFLFLMYFSQIQAGLADSSQVGDILYSILNEKQFQTLHGKEWELLRGQEVPKESQLREFWGDSSLPDARGVFLRCGNNGRCVGDGNPSGDLAIGTYQRDQFESHSHEITDPGHTHTYFQPAVGYTIGNINGTNAGGCQSATSSAVTGISICRTGGNETRPRNITVNVFIKVRATQLKPKETVQLPSEFMRQLKKDPEFVEAVKNVLSDTLNCSRR